MTKEDGIKQVMGGGGHVVILGAGSSIASTRRNAELGGKQLPSMDNFINVVGLQDIVEAIPQKLRANNFETLYGQLHNDNPESEAIREIEKRVGNYFGDMELPNEPTIYDYLVLSLRSKDLIATFNWDPFLFQAWLRNREFTTDLPHLSFLHGNVAIGYCKKEKKCGPPDSYSKATLNFYAATKLLYPVEQKNYTDDEFINKEWDRLRYWMSKESGTVRATIFGYGAPVSDVEAVSILSNTWGTPEERNMEQFEIIDIVNENELRKRWDRFIHSHHYDIVNDYFNSSLGMNPRRTSESYFSEYLFLDVNEAFRESNPVPQDFKTLQDLWNWYKPLIDAEIDAKEKTVV